ncbi:aquaporin-like protein [Periconia macrospinosa]|uniref:Aquaporin-like protein n=1 Tax=Periconia macrospinosa TaxID=97972 RepID=A0A2V1EEL0_9PLEO|nr:aquaporin-like protein [Periconia macrospinosa]
MAKAHNILPFSNKETSSGQANGNTNGKEKQNGNNSTNNALSRATRFKFAVTARWKNELVAAAAEFAGTYMFLFFAFGGTQVANSAARNDDPSTAGQENNSITQAPNTSVLLYISLIFGFSLMVNVWVFFRVSGGLFNPAVTLGLYLIGSINHTRAIMCFISQMLAGMAAAGAVKAIFPGELNVSTTLGSKMTATPVFTIFMLAAEKHKSTYLAPIGIGLALFIAELVGVFYTGGSLNPTRSFGPCVINGDFPSYHYIYWCGPLMGTLLAWAMYRVVKSVEYQTVNPGQDFDDHEAALFEPPEDPSHPDQVERPNVAAITAERAVRMASESSQERSRSRHDTRNFPDRFSRRHWKHSHRDQNGHKDYLESYNEEDVNGPRRSSTGDINE